jgi:hypothetical protein
MSIGGYGGQTVGPRIALISHWAITLARTSLRSVTTSISAMRVSLERLTRFVFGTVGIQNGTFIAGISGTSLANGVGVMINPSGKLGTVVSSARFKDNIKPMDKVSEAILALKPVTFRYKYELDPDGIPRFGLVAEDVEKVNPDLVVRGGDGKVMTVRYEAVNAMLLNEHRKVEEQDQKVHQLEAIAAQQKHELDARIAQQQKQIEALISTVQKVSEQLELTQHAPQVVSNDR